MDIFCEGIAYWADDVINSSSGMVIGLDKTRCGYKPNVQPHPEQRRTRSSSTRTDASDVRFKDSQAAENCYRRLRLDEITLREE